MQSWQVLSMGGVLVLTAWVLFVLVRHCVANPYQAISFKTFFLLGFLFFQGYSVIWPIVLDDFQKYRVNDELLSVAKFVFYGFVTVGCFLLAYRSNLFAEKLARKVPRPLFFESDSQLLMVGGVLGALCVVSRFATFLPDSLLPLYNYGTLSLSVVSVGFGAWVWGKNPNNLFYAFILFLLVSAGVFVALTAGFGRRPLLNVFMSVGCVSLLGAYRTGAVKRVMLFALPVVVFGVILLGIYSSIRTPDQTNSPVEKIGDMKAQEISSFEAVANVFNPGDTGAVSIWLVDSSGKECEVRYFFSAKYFFYHFVPRFVWPDKPDPLSLQIPYYAGMTGVALGTHTVGPGLIGHVAVEGGIFAAVLYGFLIGVIFRFLDNLYWFSYTSPLMISVLFCSMGQVFGMPRGDSSVFLGIMAIGMIEAWVVVCLIAKFLPGASVERMA